MKKQQLKWFHLNPPFRFDHLLLGPYAFPNSEVGLLIPTTRPDGRRTTSNCDGRVDEMIICWHLLVVPCWLCPYYFRYWFCLWLFSIVTLLFDSPLNIAWYLLVMLLFDMYCPIWYVLFLGYSSLILNSLNQIHCWSEVVIECIRAEMFTVMCTYVGLTCLIHHG